MLNYVQKRGTKSICLLGGSLTCHKVVILTSFLTKKTVSVLPHIFFSQDWQFVTLLMYLELKNNVAGRKFPSRNQVSLAMFKCMEGILKSDYLNVVCNG